jgi:hypothetical protein
LRPLRRRRKPVAAEGECGIEAAFGMGRDFERGVEYGLLFARVMDYGRTETPVHADLAELVIRLAESQGLPFGAAPHEHDAECGRACRDGADWLDVTIG